MKKLILFLALLFLPFSVWAMPATYGVDITEADGSPSIGAYKIVFPNGTLTCASGICAYAPSATSATFTDFYLSGPDVTHGMTSIAATSDYLAAFQIGSSGGADIYGMTEADQSGALRLTGIIGATDPTDSNPALIFRGGKKNGTGWQALGAAETAFNFYNYTTSIGRAYGNGEWIFTSIQNTPIGSTTASTGKFSSLELVKTDAITDCSGFTATGGGIFYDDSEGKFKKCQDNVLTDLDTGAIGASINDSAGDGDTTETWSADKIFDQLALKQAADADLTTYAGITPSADIQTFLGYANLAAIKAGLSIDDLVTLSGVADGSVNLGEFTGTTIADNQTVKAALQALETAVEGVGGDVTGVGDCSGGACLDGTSDGGTYIQLYDGTSSYSKMLAGVRLFTLSSGLADSEDITFTLGNNDNTVGLTSSTGADNIIGLTSYSLGSAGVKLTGDGDGALTILGLGNGYDESLTFNFDDVENTVGITSATGVTTLDASTLELKALKFTSGAADGERYINVDNSAAYKTTGPAEGDISCKASDDTCARYNGSAWIPVVFEGTASGGVILGDSSPDAAGELGYASTQLIFHDGTSARNVAKAGTLTNAKWCSSDGTVINCTEDAPAATGDVSGVGDCASGACYDGSSDGGTYVRLYDGTSAYETITGGVRTITFGSSTANSESLIMTFGDNDNSLTLSSGTSATSLNLNAFTVSANGLVPDAADGAALGSATTEWSDLYLADGGVIYGQNDQSATLTSSASTWTASAFTSTGAFTANGTAEIGDAGDDVNLNLNVNATDGHYSGVTITRTVKTGSAAEAYGQAMFINSSGELEAADSDVADAAAMPAVCILVTAGEGASKKCVISGTVTETDWNWTPGAILYVSAAPATTTGLTATRPATTGHFIQRVGVALSADTILVQPSLDVGTAP